MKHRINWFEPVAFSSAIRGLLEMNMKRLSPNQRVQFVNQFEKQYEHYYNEFMAIPAGASRAHASHVAIDEAIALDRKKHPEDFDQISCKAGCAACCYQWVVITPDEADLLARMIEEDGVEIDREQLARQAAFPKGDNEEGRWWRLPQTESRCVFLGADNKCRAYEYRPASCRKYFVRSKPEQCAVREGDQRIEGIATFDAEVIASAAMHVDHSCGSLPRLLHARLEAGPTP